MTEQPVRHTVDTITSDALDQLHARIATLEHVAAGNKRHVQLIVPDLEAALARAEQAEAAVARVTSPEAIRAAAMAIGDAALTHLGRDLGTIHVETIAEAAIRAALDAPKEPRP